MISKWKYNYTDEEKGMSLTILNKNQEINKLVDKLEEQERHIKEANAEIERLNKLISQREKKWEKWTTEKQILSSKMSDYLCKYQNIKREYTKQIKISTDRKNEIERLNNIINELEKELEERYLDFKDSECEEVRTTAYEDISILQKIKELKGSDKE